MLENANILEDELAQQNVPIIRRKCDTQNPPTHHCWISLNSQKRAFNLYLTLERMGILTNYRMLPYNLGYGLRLGLSGATQSGLKKSDIPELARLISEAYYIGYSEELANHSRTFIQRIKEGSLTEND